MDSAESNLSVEVSQPFFETLQKWLFSGELYDPYLEFFVTVDPELAHLQYVYPSSLTNGAGIMIGDGAFSGFNVDQDDITGERESGLRLWQAKYKFRQEMLPAFVGEGFGRKVRRLISNHGIASTCFMSRYSRRERVSTSFDIVAMTLIG